MSRVEARRRRKGSFWRKNRLAILGMGVVVVLAVLLTVLILSLSNPYRRILSNAGVDAKRIQWKQGVLTLTFEGDALGILSCRDALNALREKNPPKVVEWILIKDGQQILDGRVENAGALPSPTSPRLETLDEGMTLLKLKYELAQNGILSQIEMEPTVGLTGKTVTVSLQADSESLQTISTTIPAVVKAVNEEGGGILRCDVLFTSEGGLFAAASYDFAYGDTLFSSAFYEK